jgi:hypothetical protein
MTDFQYIVGQELIVDSKSRQDNGKRVKVLSRHVEPINGSLHDGERFYKVVGEGIHGYLSFFENQLKRA